MGRAGPKPGQKHSGMFQKGQSGNPGGAPKLPEDLKLLMTATSQQLKRDICIVLGSSHQTVLTLANDMSIPCGLKAIASCMDQAIQLGDAKILDTFLNRVLGRVMEAIPDDSSESKDAVNNELIQNLVKLAVANKK